MLRKRHGGMGATVHAFLNMAALSDYITSSLVGVWTRSFTLRRSCGFVQTGQTDVEMVLYTKTRFVPRHSQLFVLGHTPFEVV